MAFGWFDLIVTFGILQGILCSVLVAWQRPRTVQAKLLIAVLLVFSLLSFKIQLHTLGLWQTTIFRYFPLGIDLLIQPLLFLYVCSLTNSGFRLRKQECLHLMPALVFMLHAVFIYIIVLGENSLSVKDVKAEFWHYNLIKRYEDYLSLISTAVYGYLIVKRIGHYQAWLEQNISDSNIETFKWLKYVVWTTGIMGTALFVNIIGGGIAVSGLPFVYWQLFYVYLAVIIYILGLKGYFRIRNQHLQLAGKFTAQEVPVYAGKFDHKDLAKAKQTIHLALEQQRLFLDNELTLQKLAKQIHLSPALVSAAVNTENGKGFRTLINEFRVEEAKKQLTNPGNSHLSITGIGFECGFNSEASFFRIFKEFTGLSPKQFIRQSAPIV